MQMALLPRNTNRRFPHSLQLRPLTPARRLLRRRHGRGAPGHLCPTRLRPSVPPLLLSNPWPSRTEIARHRSLALSPLEIPIRSLLWHWYPTAAKSSTDAGEMATLRRLLASALLQAHLHPTPQAERSLACRQTTPARMRRSRSPASTPIASDRAARHASSHACVAGSRRAAARASATHHTLYSPMPSAQSKTLARLLHTAVLNLQAR